MSFEIRDSAIDTVALSKRIEQGISVRRARAVELGLDFEAMAGLTSFSDLDEALTLIRLSYDAIRLEPEFLGPPTSPWRHPFRWFKQQAHSLVVYYVNRLGCRQMVFNCGGWQLLEFLLTEHQAELTRLRGQVADLAEQLRNMEQSGKR